MKTRDGAPKLATNRVDHVADRYKCWCVAWVKRDAAGRVVPGVEWCATKDGREHPDEANHAATACGYVVTMPVGSEYREPTCHGCINRQL